jgi:soluble lytic murein transglycosylase
LNDADVLAQIPPPAALPALDAPIPAGVRDRWERAQALRGIALDEFAETELRAAHAVARLPRLLVEAARAANAAGRYWQSVSAGRQAVPQLEARSLQEVPEEIWRLIYPLPYAASLERYAARANVDPMLAAGIIRQESIFQRDAVSRAGAVGLMQILPVTGRQLARQLRVGYARARLTEPEYNLRLGTVYLAQMIARHGSVERALAAYNAGPDRLVLWQAERTYEEPAEFVQSIPFTETREYVQIVLRNAELYRRLYGTAR